MVTYQRLLSVKLLQSVILIRVDIEVREFHHYFPLPRHLKAVTGIIKKVPIIFIDPRIKNWGLKFV